MTTGKRRREINGALWIVSGAAVVLMRFLFYRDSAFQAWLVVGVVMMVMGFGQIWRFRRTRRMESRDSSNQDRVR